MFSKVKVSRNALEYFRLKARKAFPLEIQSYMLGTITSVDEIIITDFMHTKSYAEQTTGSVGWTIEEYNRIETLADSLNKKIVGDIHSHPSWDAVMSKQDYVNAIKDMHLICGICSVNNKTESRVRFWNLTSPLPCIIKYS